MSRRQHAAPSVLTERPSRRAVPAEEEELDPRVQRFLRFMAAAALRSLLREQEESTVRDSRQGLHSDNEET